MKNIIWEYAYKVKSNHVIKKLSATAFLIQCISLKKEAELCLYIYKGISIGYFHSEWIGFIRVIQLWQLPNWLLRNLETIFNTSAPLCIPLGQTIWASLQIIIYISSFIRKIISWLYNVHVTAILENDGCLLIFLISCHTFPHIIRQNWPSDSWCYWEWFEMFDVNLYILSVMKLIFNLQ